MTCFDEASTTSGYARYLAAKTTVDDRALNRPVLAELCRLMPAGAPRVLEVGAGLGTMVARLLDWGVVGAGEYVLLDADRQLLDCSCRWLRDWAAARGVRSDLLPDGLQVGDLRVRLVHAELGGYLEAAHGELADVLIANAVLDLVDVRAVLPGLLRLLVPGGVYWFTINYDGETIFEPGHPLDDQVMRAYHRDMDERIRYGRPAGESRTGRLLFHHLRDAGAPALAAGSSDWVVHPARDGNYPADEAYFLRRILNTIRDALRNRPDRVEPADLADWLAVRCRQLTAGDLVYIAHQLDFVGRSPGGEPDQGSVHQRDVGSQHADGRDDGGHQAHHRAGADPPDEHQQQRQQDVRLGFDGDRPERPGGVAHGEDVLHEQAAHDDGFPGGRRQVGLGEHVPPPS